MIYLDHASTTFIDHAVVDVIQHSLKTHLGNPSSTHQLGFSAVKALNETKTKIGDMIHAQRKQLIFTSSGTEANNLIIHGVYQRLKNLRFITTKIEHSSVLHTFEYLESLGADVYYLKVNQEGTIDFDDLSHALDVKTALVSIMYGNNELGTLQDIKKIADLCHQKGALFHSDMVQILLHKKVDVSELSVDFASFSAHKFKGPKGIGLVYAKDIHLLSAHMQGGAQEYRLRPGTENVAYAEGFLKALEITEANRQTHERIIDALSSYFITKLYDAKIEFEMNGPALDGDRLKATLNLAFKDVDAQRLKFHLEQHEIYVSLGSACNAKSILPSHVLSHLYDEKRVSESLRFSLGSEITHDDIDVVINTLLDFMNKTH